jgi:hypothetical protein
MNEPAPTPPRAPSRWTGLARPEMIVAISAIFISLCALGVSAYEAHLVRKQQRASVWPHLMVAYGFTGERFAILVVNHGVGPARISDVGVTLDGRPMTDWDNLFLALSAGDHPSQYVTSPFNRMVVPAGATYEPLVIDLAVVRAGDRENAARMMQVLLDNLPRLGVAVTYASVYDDHWRCRLGAPLPQEIPAAEARLAEDLSFRE